MYVDTTERKAATGAALPVLKSRADAMSRRLNYFIARDQMLAQFIEDSRLHAAQRSSLSALALANPLPTSDFLSGVDY